MSCLITLIVSFVKAPFIILVSRISGKTVCIELVIGVTRVVVFCYVDEIAYSLSNWILSGRALLFLFYLYPWLLYSI